MEMLCPISTADLIDWQHYTTRRVEKCAVSLENEIISSNEKMHKKFLKQTPGV